MVPTTFIAIPRTLTADPTKTPLFRLGGRPWGRPRAILTSCSPDGGLFELPINVGTIEEAQSLVRMWAGKNANDIRIEPNGVTGFDAALRITLDADEATIETTTDDEPLSADEAAQLFAIEHLSANLDDPYTNIESALGRIRELARDGHAPNVRRQIGWLGIRDGEVIALQTLGDFSCVALARSVEEVIRLTSPAGLVAINRWGRTEKITFQGVYTVPNRLVGRIEETCPTGQWRTMAKGIVTDERIRARMFLMLDFDTKRRDMNGRAVDLPISATKDELHKTIARALHIRRTIIAVLLGMNIQPAADVVAFLMSGNGVQLWLALDETRVRGVAGHHQGTAQSS